MLLYVYTQVGLEFCQLFLQLKSYGFGRVASGRCLTGRRWFTIGRFFKEHEHEASQRTAIAQCWSHDYVDVVFASVDLNRKAVACERRSLYSGLASSPATISPK